MKRLLIVLLFLLSFLTYPIIIGAKTGSVYAQCTVKELDASTNIVEKIFTLFFGWFTKTDYTIKNIDTKTKIKDMTEYGDINDENFKEKQAFAGSRSQNSNNQNCYKGNVIKQTVLGTLGYKNVKLAQICLDDNCSIISVNDLANYFVQNNQQFYCDDNNKLIDIEADFSNKVSQLTDLADTTIPETKKTCYRQIYDNFYLTPKDNTDENEKNTKNIAQTPISASEQNSNDSVTDIKNKVKQNLTPEGKLWDSKLNFICPENWNRTKGLSEAGVGTGSYEGGVVSSGTCNAKDSHCRGMSTIGAYGLAKSGKTYEEILKNYYGDISFKTIDISTANITIIPNSNDNCSSTTLNLETYLSGLQEIPDSWGDLSNGGYESLKAQVVAARTYAYVYTQNLTKSICTSSNCQNISCNTINSNPNLDKAIKETEGQIIVDSTNQTPFATEYARSFCGPSLSVTYTNHSTPSFNGYDAEISTGEKLYCL